MRFAELSDEQWEFIKPHIPPQPIVGYESYKKRGAVERFFGIAPNRNVHSGQELQE